MASRLKGVRLDPDINDLYMSITKDFQKVERRMSMLPRSAEWHKSMDKLEESHMWLGKMFRAQQLERYKKNQEESGNE